MEYTDRRRSQIQRAIREEREQEHWNEVHNQLLAIQKKSLEVNDRNDADEKEADEVARKVMSGESAEIHGTGGTINRKGEGSFETTPGFQSKLESSKGGGQSLDNSTKSEMESKMGADFSGVKIHTGGEANAMNESVNAKAFTHGQDIYFGSSHSPQDKELLAHELVHTVQQGKGSPDRKIQQKQGDGPENKEGFKKVVPPISTMVKRDGVSMRVSDNNQSLEMARINRWQVVDVTWKSDVWVYCTVNQQSGYINKFELIAFRNDDKLPEATKVTWGGEPFEISIKSDQDANSICFVVKYTGKHKAYDDLFMTKLKTQFEHTIKWSNYYNIQENLNTKVYKVGNSFIQYDLFSDRLGEKKVFASITHKSEPRDFNQKHFMTHDFSISLGDTYKASGAGMIFYIEVPGLKGKEDQYTSQSEDVKNEYNEPVNNILPEDVSLKEVSMSVVMPGNKILYKDPGDWKGGSQAETLNPTTIKLTLSTDYLLLNFSPFLFLRPTGWIGGTLADDFEWYSAKYDFKTKKITNVDIRYAENYGANVGMETAISSIKAYIESLLKGTRMGDEKDYNPFQEKDLIGTLLTITNELTAESDTETEPKENETVTPAELTGFTFSVTSSLKKNIEHLEDGTGIVLNADKPIMLTVAFDGTVQDLMDYDKPESRLSIKEVVTSGNQAFVIKHKNKELLDLKQITIHNGGEVTVDNFDLYGWLKDIETVEKTARGLLGIVVAIAYIARFKKSGVPVPANSPMPGFVDKNLTKTTTQILLEDEMKKAVLEQLEQYHDAVSKLIGEDTQENVREKFDFYKLLNITPPAKK